MKRKTLFKAIYPPNTKPTNPKNLKTKVRHELLRFFNYQSVTIEETKERIDDWCREHNIEVVK